MSRKLIHMVAAVNAANVRKDATTYTIANVCGAVDDIVMNSMLYPADQLAAGVASMEGRPAPAGHPKDANGRFISATNGEALAAAWCGAYVRNARHEGGRSLFDVVVNEAQAKAHPDGVKLLERLDGAIAGTNTEPIPVSTGLYVEPIQANGESRGKAYNRIATAINYDHLAILFHDRPAGAPDEGVGMFLNAAGEEEEVEHVAVNTAPEDRRAAGWRKWLAKLLGNADDVSFDQISEALYKALPQGAWLREVFDRYAIWADADGRLWQQDYSISADGSVAFAGTAQEVTRKVSYEPISNHQKGDPMKDKILAALNAAGIATDGKSDEQLMRDFTALQVAPVQEKLTAANSKVAEFEANARAAEDAEVGSMAAELAKNSALSVDDFKALGIKRLRELKATAGAGKAAGLNAGGAPAGNAADEFAAYDPNEHFNVKKEAA